MLILRSPFDSVVATVTAIPEAINEEELLPSADLDCHLNDLTEHPNAYPIPNTCVAIKWCHCEGQGSACWQCQYISAITRGYVGLHGG